MNNYCAEVKCKSLHPDSGKVGALTTMTLTYPRCIHSEFMTHAMFSRNAASSRAIPIQKMMDDVRYSPFIPLHWGQNQSGMQAYAQIENKEQAIQEWLLARDNALSSATKLKELNLHKQIVNRVLEPWMWITVVVTGSSVAWENFFHLRCHEAAEPHMQKIAYMARDAYDAEEGTVLKYREWHLPFIKDEDRHAVEAQFNVDEDDSSYWKMLAAISTGRCARVSYLTHEGVRDIHEDIALHNKLQANGHWSPFGHIAECDRLPRTKYGRKEVSTSAELPFGNLCLGWVQYRKLFDNEVCKKANRNGKSS